MCQGAVNLTVERSGDLGEAVMIDYATIDQTATAGQDYVATRGQLVFEPCVCCWPPTVREKVHSSIQTLCAHIAGTRTTA